MPAFIINTNVNGFYTEVANTDPAVMYQFLGDTPEATTQSIIGFTNELVANGADQQAMADAIGNYLDIGEETGEAVLQALFSTTDMVVLVDQVIYGTVGEDVLIDELAEVGQAILAAAGALVIQS